jgi:predicted Ser/Thr protein kinase/tetratricopeptide (TPR) repeat protein
VPDDGSRTPTQRDARVPDTTRPEGAGGADELQPGATLGRYVILKRIGRGGMGIVYLAFDNELERRVALKVLRPISSEVGSDETRARLLREAQALAKVSHANVVSVFDVATYGGEVFVAMEYIDGSTLREWRSAKPRTVREILSAYLQAGRGLEAAHAVGILHRDFKPDNLLMDERGRVKVVDFGLARLEDGVLNDTIRPPPIVRRTADSSGVLDTPLTELGALVGTPAYMAPEQLVGEKVDARTDQFSFCVTLHEALYGEKPFAAASSSVTDLVDAIYDGKMRPVPSSPRVPLAVRRALRRGLSGSPEDRFASIGDLLAAVERAMGSPRRWLAGVSAGAVVAAGVVIALTRPAAAKPCRGADDALAPVWNPARATAVERAFEQSKNPRWADAASRTRGLLDRYAAAWINMSTSACEATRLLGVQSEEGLDLRMGCLRQRQKELQATVDLFTRADAKMVDGAVEAAARLTPVDSCVDIAALRAPYAPPSGGPQRLAVEDLRRRLAEVDALIAAGRRSDAYPVAEELVEEAERTGYAPARAEALWRKGRVASYIAKSNAMATLFDAAVEAESVRADEIAARAWTQLVFEEGYVADHYEQAARYGRLSEAAIRRLGGNDGLRADLLDRQSQVATGRGASLDAQRLAREALALREKIQGPTHPDTLATRSNLADGLWDHGEADEALAMYEQLHRDEVAFLGETHPSTLRTLLDITEAKREMGDYDAALALVERIRAGESADTPELHVAAMKLQLAYTLIPLGRVSEGLATFESAIAMTGSVRGEQSSFVASHYGTCGRILVQHGEDALAETYANKSIAMLGGSGERDEDVSEAIGVRALCKARRGDWAGAVADADKAIAAKEKQFGARADLIPLLARGQALVATHHEADGVADLQHALAIGDANAGDLAIRADVRFALARALAATGGDRARVAKEASRAAADLDRAGLPDAAKRVRAWLVR